MNGLIIVDKDKFITSRDVVNNLNHIFNIKKIGHTGTLDPIATGVLVCLIGKYTKLGNLITALDKEYIAEIKLGIKTDTLDITGNVIEEKNFNITKEQIKKVFASFPHEYMQTVPEFSAVKINGKKLYEYAREKQKIDLPQRKVTIYSLELLDYSNGIIKFKTKVSKGTYIRSLIMNICEYLDTIGTMSSLRRIKQGIFTVDNAYTLEDIKNNNYKLLNIKDFLDYPIIELKKEEYFKVINGVKLENIYNVEDKVIFTYQNEDIAIYTLDNNYLKNLKMYLKLID